MSKVLSAAIKVFVVLLGLTLCLWFTLPYYLQSVANHFSHLTGVTITGFSAETPQWKQWKIHHFSLKLADKNTLQAKGIQLDFQWFPFALHQVDANFIRIETYSSENKTSSNPNIQLDKPTVALPRINIQQLQIIANDLAALTTQASLHFTPNAEQYALNFALQAPFQLQGNVNIDWQDSLTVHADIKASLDSQQLQGAIKALKLPVALLDQQESVQLRSQLQLVIPSRFRVQQLPEIIEAQTHLDLSLPSVRSFDITIPASQWQSQLTLKQSKLQWTLNETQPLLLTLPQDVFEDTELTTSLDWQDFAIHFDWTMPSKLTTSGVINFKTTIQEENVSLKLAKINASLMDQTFNISFESHLFSQDLALTTPEYLVNLGTLNLHSQHSFSIPPDGMYAQGSSQLTINEITLNSRHSSPNVTISDLTTEVKNWQLTSNFLQEHTSLVYQAKGTTQFSIEPLTMNTNRLPLHTHHIQWRLNEQFLTGQQAIQLPDTPMSLRHDFSHDLRNQVFSGQVFLSLKNDFFSGLDLSQWLVDNPYSLAIYQGSLDAKATYSGTLQPSFNLTADGELAVQSLDFAMYASEFLGYSNQSDFRLRLTPEFNFSAFSHSTLDKLQLSNDIVATQVKAIVSMPENTQVNVTSLSLALLEGDIRLQPFSVDLINPEFETEMQISHVELSSINQLLQTPGLEMQGGITGTLPLAFKSGKATIHDGLLKNRAPGVIAYRPNNQLDTLCIELSNATNVQNYALQNFQFDELAATINLNETNTYHVKLRLEGANPNFCQGKPIILNVNLNYEVPEQLFMYMLMGEDFFKQIYQEAQ
ncbi:MAG: YdbH domain-containing protein [Pseudomonadota bacterium]